MGLPDAAGPGRARHAAMWDLIRQGRPPSAARVSAVVAADAVRLGAEGVGLARSEFAAQVLGLGPLEPLLADPAVTDVLVNGGDRVWVDRGVGLEPVPCQVGGAEGARRLAVRLAGLAGRRLDEACPYVDGLLPGGVRLHAVLPPLVDGGAHLSLRVPRRVAPTLSALRRAGCFPPGWEPALSALVASRTSFVVTGGAGAGKTTLLAALLALADPGERIVVVEDVQELAVDHPHVVRLQSRAANVEDRGGVAMAALVRQSLRMRPDRLVVGEVRGAEVRELLGALNTGHDGGCGTLHANGLPDVVARFEALGALAGLSRDALAAQLVSAVRVVLHLRRVKGLRQLDAIGVLTRSGGEVRVLPAMTRSEGGGPSGSAPPGWGLLSSWLGLPEERPR